MPNSHCVILTTAGSADEADRLAEMLVARRLAACVQVANIASTYRWQGNITKEAEFLLLIKSDAHLYDRVEAAILENHSYDVPEIIQLPIERGLNRYFDWIDENTE